jgi:Spy/CpxP family protein refolding chaperone
MKKSKMLAVVLGMAMLFSGMLAANVEAFGPHKHGGGCLGLRTLRALGLSDAQKADLADIIDKYREQGKAIRDQLSAVRESSIEEIQALPFDDGYEQKVRQVFQDQIAQPLEDMMVLKSKFMAEFRMLLSDEQLEILEERRSELSKRREEDMQSRESMINTWLQMTVE